MRESSDRRPSAVPDRDTEQTEWERGLAEFDDFHIPGASSSYFPGKNARALIKRVVTGPDAGKTVIQIHLDPTFEPVNQNHALALYNLVESIAGGYYEQGTREDIGTGIAEELLTHIITSPPPEIIAKDSTTEYIDPSSFQVIITGDNMDKAAVIHAAAEQLSKVYPAEDVREAIEYLAAKEAARETTSRSATVTPRLKWETDRDPDEDPATFAWRAYAAEAKAGTLHRGVIAKEDKPLAGKLASWLRSHPMPEGIDIPTLPEWNTRQIEAGKAKQTAAPRPRTEGNRLYAALRRRRAPSAGM